MNRCFDKSGRSFCKGKCIIFAEGVVTPVLVTVEVSMKQLECLMTAYPPEGNSSPFSLASLRNQEVTNSKINTYRLLWTGLILTYNLTAVPTFSPPKLRRIDCAGDYGKNAESRVQAHNMDIALSSVEDGSYDTRWTERPVALPQPNTTYQQPLGVHRVITRDNFFIHHRSLVVPVFLV